MKNKNDIIILDITDLNNLGYGVGRADDGVVVFVNGTVTGDRIKAKIIKVTSKYYAARCEKIIIRSPYRCDEDICSAPASCGGCVYRYVDRECELKMKQAYIKSLLCREGLSDIEVNFPRTAGDRTKYRNKAQYPVRNTGGKICAGLFANKTHSLVYTDRCALEPDVFADIVKDVCVFAEMNGITAYDEKNGTGLLRHIYIRIGEKCGEIMLCLVINGDAIPKKNEFITLITKKYPDIRSILLNINKENTNVVTGKQYITIYGEPYIHDELCGLRFRISPEAFWQVNRNGAELLYTIAREFAGLTGKEYLLDLYCGTGSIGLSMARYAAHVTGVEIVPQAVECARINARQNGIENADFYCADASDTGNIIPSDRYYDIVLLDPTRKGLARELTEYIAKKGINKVVYISCAPDTLARDMAVFYKLGYKCLKLQPVDMFPMTGHVEMVCLLSKLNTQQRYPYGRT